jgi:hypothetical protein
MMNRGYANRIAIENEVLLDYYRRAGIPTSKMEVVGSVHDDLLAGFLADRENARAALGRELSIDLDRPLWVIGGCPNQLGGSAPGFDFARIEGMVEHIVRCLEPMADRVTIVVRPHPNYLHLADLFGEHGISSTTIETARLIALADGYIAFASATIRWAIACGVPTVNYDVFHYDYDDFDDVPGVLPAASPEEFRLAVARLDPAGPEREILQARIDEEKGNWATLDGRSLDRIEALIESLCRLDRVPRTTR